MHKTNIGIIADNDENKKTTSLENVEKKSVPYFPDKNCSQNMC